MKIVLDKIILYISKEILPRRCRATQSQLIKMKISTIQSLWIMVYYYIKINNKGDNG